MATAEEEKYDYQTPVICDQCKAHKNVHTFCLDCRTSLCDVCKEEHSVQGHNVLPRTHPKVGKVRQLASKHCLIHQGNQYIKYCNKCAIACCALCVSNDHNDHSFEDIVDAAEDCRSDLKSLLVSLETTTLPNAEKFYDGILEKINVYNSVMLKTRNESREHFHLLRHQIDCAEKEWMALLDDMEMKDTAEMEKRKQHA